MQLHSRAEGRPWLTQVVGVPARSATRAEMEAVEREITDLQVGERAAVAALGGPSPGQRAPAQPGGAARRGCPPWHSAALQRPARKGVHFYCPPWPLSLLRPLRAHPAPPPRRAPIPACPQVQAKQLDALIERRKQQFSAVAACIEEVHTTLEEEGLQEEGALPASPAPGAAAAAGAGVAAGQPGGGGTHAGGGLLPGAGGGAGGAAARQEAGQQGRGPAPMQLG